jgi:antitoxin (DNA-binding transcriptional repressor) of toxin-antitoxin stability system
LRGEKEIMMQQVTPEEARAHLAELMDAALRGERVVIARDDQHAVQLIPVTPTRQSRQAGSAKGLIVIHEDFDAPLDDFTEYMQ